MVFSPGEPACTSSLLRECCVHWLKAAPHAGCPLLLVYLTSLYQVKNTASLEFTTRPLFVSPWGATLASASGCSHLSGFYDKSGQLKAPHITPPTVLLGVDSLSLYNSSQVRKQRHRDGMKFDQGHRGGKVGLNKAGSSASLTLLPSGSDIRGLPAELGLMSWSLNAISKCACEVKQASSRLCSLPRSY